MGSASSSAGAATATAAADAPIDGDFSRLCAELSLSVDLISPAHADASMRDIIEKEEITIPEMPSAIEFTDDELGRWDNRASRDTDNL